MGMLPSNGNEVQIPGNEIEPKRPFLDALRVTHGGYVPADWAYADGGDVTPPYLLP